MTTVLGLHSFTVEPAIDFNIEAILKGKQLAKAGKKRQYAGHGDLTMTLTGSLEGASAYSNRDILIAYLIGGTKVDFYSTTILYGTALSPKAVWIESFECNHPEGIPQYLEYVITIVEET